MIKKFAMLVAVIALSGCGTTYTYNGQKYDSKEKFQQAVDSTVSDVLSTIAPLPTPLTQRKLIFAMPSEATLFNETVSRHVKQSGSQPNALQNEMFENLSKANYKNIRVFFEAVLKKNIFASTQFIPMQAMTGSFAASSDTDTLYMVEPSPGSNQWYYASFKQGKQIFAYDRSSPDPAGKVQAFVDAVQAQAIRD